MQKKFNILIVLLTIVALALSACGGAGDASGGRITISGAFALYPMMTRWAEEFQRTHPGVVFDVSGGGAGKGMTDALSGAVDIGMVSRSIKPEEEAQGAYGVAVVKDAVFPTINANNPVLTDILAQGISQETLIKIFITGEITTWGQVVGRPEVTDEIHVYTRSDACGAAEMWAKFLGDKAQEDLLGVGVNADPGVLEAVVKDSLGIGYNNLGYAFDPASGKVVAGAFVPPIDLNKDGKADTDETIESLSDAVESISTGRYPSPPARPLNVVTKGKPSGIVQAFIEWILTDGQQYVGEAGYVQLTPEELTASLEKVR
jgi:phosphate transport system substrate-binding protein